MNNTKSNLAGLALRKYAEKSYFHNSLVVSLMCNDQIHLKADDPLRQDIPTLQALIADFNAHYCDLWTPHELARQICYLPQDERTLREKRIEDLQIEILGQDGYDYLQAIITCQIPIPENFPIELKEKASLCRLRYALDNGLDLSIVDKESYTDSEPLPQFEDESSLDLLPFEEPEPVIEPLPVIPTNSKPEDHTVKPKQSLQLRRAYAGIFEQ